MELKNFFNPLGVAVVGASSDKHKVGRQVLNSIIKNGYGGHIYPINRDHTIVAGLPAFASLEMIPAKNKAAILVVIVIPAPFVLEEIKKCARLGIKNIIIISAGFKESGAEGAIKEVAVTELAKKHKLNILGPNCLGFINNNNRLNASFADSGAGGGQIAFLSQSGAIGSAVLDWLKNKSFNLGYFISLGNKAVLDENDFLEYLATDKKTNAIFFYLEDIKDGQKFMSLVSKISPKKPIIVLKSGISERGGQMAKSHTGAMAGSMAAIKAGLARSGAIMIESLEELFDLLLIFQAKGAYGKITSDLRILTNAGGVAVLSADEISRQNLNLKESLDILGDAGALKYEKALDKMLSVSGHDNILVLLTPQTATEPMLTAESIIKVDKKYAKRLVLANFLGEAAVAKAKDFLLEHNVPAFNYPERAIRAIKRLADRQELIKSLAPFYKMEFPLSNVQVDYLYLFGLLNKYKFPVVKTVRYENLASISYPVVLKAVGPDFLHKTDKGAIMLNLENRQALDKTAHNFVKHNKKVLQNKANYLVVQPQVKNGLEIILGFKRDVSFGPLILVGIGGIYAEIFKEFRTVIADLDKQRALEFIKSLPFYPILTGARGAKKYNIKQLVNILIALSRLANEHPEIKEFDINPLFLKEDGALAGDVRAII
ncbi:MAG TPA: acetate--CoA ligase family protein [Candidatus Saccharimonadales bacterium]|nr:acetate--CoA ligase family protein [Candidatus Saccharimonadales bacterium]